MDAPHQSSKPSDRLVPKMIAVGSEVVASLLIPAGAGALASGQPIAGSLILALYAAFLTTKNWSQGVTSGEAQAIVEGLLVDQKVENGNIRDAVEAISIDQHIHELVSRERAQELAALLQFKTSEIEMKISENQEVVFHLARFMERWCDQHGADVEKIQDSLDGLPRIERLIMDGFSKAHADVKLTHEKLDRFERKLDRLADAGTKHPVAIANVPANVLRMHFLRISKPLLAWRQTVGLGNNRIACSAETTLLKLVTKEPSSASILLGPKGSGKSALSAAVAAGALERGMAVLAIKADMIPAEIGAADTLHAVLDLPIAITDAIDILRCHRPVLLLVDQLDSVSELTDRLSNRLNLLLNLIREVSGRQNVHVVAACREFDFRHDARLATIEADEVSLALPDWDMLVPALRAEGHDPDGIAPAMRELLRTPWNLNLFLKVGKPREVFASMQSLIEQVWQKSVTNAAGDPNRTTLLERLAKRMSCNEELFVPLSIADDLPAARDALLREEILVQAANGKALAFRHQTFYDFTLARMFARETTSLAEHVLRYQDGLFVRPVMLNGLELLRGISRNAYHRQVHAIMDGAPSYHIRTLLIEFVAQQRDPDDMEGHFVSKLIRTEDGPLVLRAAAGSGGWFTRLRQSGDLTYWMQRPPREAAFTLGLLIAALQQDAQAVYQLVRANWSADAGYDGLSLSVASRLSAWNDSWGDMVSSAVARSAISIIWMAGQIADESPTIASRLVRAELDRRLAEAKKAAAVDATENDKSADPIARYLKSRYENAYTKVLASADDLHGLEEIAKQAPRQFFEGLWPWFLEALDGAEKDYPSTGASYIDDCATGLAYDAPPDPVIRAMHAAADAWAAKSSATFVAFVGGASATNLLAGHRVLAQGLAVAAPTQPKAALEYLVGDPRRLAIGTHQDAQRFTRTLIASVSPFLTDPDRRRLEAAIIALETFPKDAYASRSAEDRFKMTKWNREDRLRLLRAIPHLALGDSARALKSREETALPLTSETSGSSLRGGFVGARVSADEMAKAHNADILGLIDDLESRGSRWPHHRNDIEPARSGGLLEQSREFSVLAERCPDRVVRFLGKLQVGRKAHETFVGAALGGLAKSDLSSVAFFQAVSDEIARGFSSEDFCDSVASALQTRAAKGDVAPPSLVSVLEEWLPKQARPIEADRAIVVDTRARRAPIIFRRGGFSTALMDGRAALFRSIASICEARTPVDSTTLFRVIRARIGIETNPDVLAEMLWSSKSIFTVEADIADATAIFDSAIRGCPAVLAHELLIFILGQLTGFFKPCETYEAWLGLIRGRGDNWSKQAFGELLFLYYGRRGSEWADFAITREVAADDRDVLLGMSYAAAEGFPLMHCRRRATDVLCAAASAGNPEIFKTLELALIPLHEGRFDLDSEADRLIDAICESQPALKALGARLLESVAPSAGIRPEIVLRICNKVLATIPEDHDQLARPLNSAAAAITSIAITLHRQPEHRRDGLELFERLLKMGVYEAAAALELLDRKPHQPGQMSPFIRRPKRRR